MKYKLSEKKVLKKLGIPDFRHMTKDKIMSFASMLPFMDPEVAKKALEQFPVFKELACDMVMQYKAVVDKIFDENRVSQQAFYDACNAIIESLQEELRNDDIDSIERDRIENKMIKIAEMIGEKDRDNKIMLFQILSCTAGIVAVCVAASAAILGLKTRFSQGDDLLGEAGEDCDVAF